MKYILALDEGTTSARALVYNVATNEVVNVAKLPFTQHFPKPGWVEHDAEEIWQSIKKAINIVMDGINPQDLFGIGITNQRETVVAWDKRTGIPACPAIVWQCRRTAKECNELKESKISKIIKLKTGLLPDAYFSATKIKWMLSHEPKVQELLKDNNLMVGTIDSYLIYRLTDCKVHVTDVTNASRTMLFNIHDLNWDPFLLKYFGIPENILPKVVDSSGIVGYTDFFGKPIPIAGIAGDQQASLIGQGCINKGDTKNTYGTGCFALINTGSSIISSRKLVTTVAYKIGKTVAYALEGSIFNAGSAIDWVCKDLRLIRNPDKMNALATSVPDSNGVYLVPAFTGLGCPYWDMEATGMITGITRGTTIPHLARAVFECIAYSSSDVIKIMEKDSKLKIDHISVDGGASKNDFLMQFQSDILTKSIITRPIESSCMGVIFLAGLATGAYNNFQKLPTKVKTIEEYHPKINSSEAKQKLVGWNKAINQCLYK